MLALDPVLSKTGTGDDDGDDEDGGGSSSVCSLKSSVLHEMISVASSAPSATHKTRIALFVGPCWIRLRYKICETMEWTSSRETTWRKIRPCFIMPPRSTATAYSRVSRPRLKLIVCMERCWTSRQCPKQGHMATTHFVLGKLAKTIQSGSNNAAPGTSS